MQRRSVCVLTFSLRVFCFRELKMGNLSFFFLITNTCITSDVIPDQFPDEGSCDIVYQLVD